MLCLSFGIIEDLKGCQSSPFSTWKLWVLKAARTKFVERSTGTNIYIDIGLICSNFVMKFFGSETIPRTEEDVPNPSSDVLE